MRTSEPDELEARLEEERLWRDQSRAGNMAAFEKLVLRFTSRVYAQALRLTRNPQDAQEVTQDTFLAAYQRLGDLHGDGVFGAWVTRIAANFALMRLRRQKIAHEAEQQMRGGLDFDEDGTILTPPLAEWAKRPDEQILDRELRGAIERATAALPEAYRTVFLLKDVDGLSYEEIGEAVGDSVPAVKSRLHRARLSLRQAIDDFYAGRAPLGSDGAKL